MPESEFEQFGITKEEFDSICAKKDKIRNYTFGISSAVGIITGCIFGTKLSNGVYETVLFILFFGCFLGSLFGAVFTITVVRGYGALQYIFSPAYRISRQILSKKARAGSRPDQCKNS